jgi:C-terminal processing protease CtpA/Prc
MRILTCMIVLLMSMVSCLASEQDITAAERNEIIDKVIDNLANKYVDPNLGKKTAEIIKQKKEQNAYDSLNQKSKLIRVLIADMHKATNDKHLQLVDPKGFDQAPPDGSAQTRPTIQIFNPNATSQSDIKQNKLIQEMLKRMNYGLKDAKVLDGNIGYLDIRQFTSPGMDPEVFQAIDKTLKSFQNCSGMILDLRLCSAGGDPEVMMYMASYFLSGDEPELLYELYDRDNKKIKEFGTRPDISGKYQPDVPLYILVSAKTFSAGEMFAYGLQKIGRATIIGETSAGAAHETNTVGIGHGIFMVLPINKLQHVKTKTDWEGTGVIPDIPVKADQALDAAKDIIQKAKQNEK